MDDKQPKNRAKMNETYVIFPQGPSRGKIGYFCKNGQNRAQHQYTYCFIILQKLCKILAKKFRTNLTNFWPRWTWGTQFPIFVRYPRKLMTNNEKTSQNLWKMGHISRCNLPGKNGSFLQKCPKSYPTSKYVRFHYFVKRLQNSRKTFLNKIDP